MYNKHSSVIRVLECPGSPKMRDLIRPPHTVSQTMPSMYEIEHFSDHNLSCIASCDTAGFWAPGICPCFSGQYICIPLSSALHLFRGGGAFQYPWFMGIVHTDLPLFVEPVMIRVLSSLAGFEIFMARHG